ncbi:MAG: hypothetical protein IPL64_15985 [Flavobacteriales bacterium]|nr:hypothetical protein [Flavobacteriales bacterium]
MQVRSAFTLHELNDCMGASQPNGSVAGASCFQPFSATRKREFTWDVKLNTKGDWSSHSHAFTEAIIRLTPPPLHGRIP